MDKKDKKLFDAIEKSIRIYLKLVRWNYSKFISLRYDNMGMIRLTYWIDWSGKLSDFVLRKFSIFREYCKI